MRNNFLATVAAMVVSGVLVGSIMQRLYAPKEDQNS